MCLEWGRNWIAYAVYIKFVHQKGYDLLSAMTPYLSKDRDNDRSHGKTKKKAYTATEWC